MTNTIKNSFKSIREFYQKFPSGFYICTECGYMNANAYTCSRCGFRADGLFKTMDKGYKYHLEDSDTDYEIFIPLELTSKK